MDFVARWSWPLRLVSGGVSLGCLIGGYAALRVAGAWLGAPVLAIPAIALLFTVRGYRVEGDALLVRRALWSTRIPLAGLRAAEADPSLLDRSWRVFGNGGLFSISGLFHNRRLGRYRAWMTERRDAVVLRFDDRVLVVSPASPRAFIAHLRTRRLLP